MARTIAEIAQALGGRLAGDGAMPVRAIARSLDGVEPDELALAMEKGDPPKLPQSRARMAVVTEGTIVPQGLLAAHIEVRRPRHALAILTRLFDTPVRFAPGRHPTAVVDTGATLGENVSLGPFAYVGPGASIGGNTIVMSHVTIGAGAIIGEDCLFHPGARVGERVRIGNRVILQMNAVVGADGFSFVTPQPGTVETAKASGEVKANSGRLQRVNSIGTVVLHDDVEIGACATIDRATIAATVIGRASKIDNLVTVAHNCVIGENCMISGQAGIAGSSEIGDRVVLAGKAGIADHVQIGNDSVVGARTGVPRSLPPKSVVFGLPAEPRDRAFAKIRTEARMSRYLDRVDSLMARLAAFEGRSGKAD